MATKLVLLLCLLAVALAAEDETVWFEPKTWTGPGVLPEELREDVTAFDWEDGIVSRRRNIGPESPVELPPTVSSRSNRRRAVRRKLEELLNIKDYISPTKLKEQFEQVLPHRSMPKQKVPVKIYEDKGFLPLEKQPTRRSGAYTAVESGPNWLGMLGSFGEDEETRRRAPSVIVNEQNADDSKYDSQFNAALDLENQAVDEKPSLKALPGEKQAEVDISTWQKPNCLCVRRTTESPIQTSRRVIDGSGTRIVYQRRKSSSIKCSCSSDAVAEMLETPHDARKELDAQEDATQNPEQK